MKLDLTVIKNESILKFEKSIEKVGDKFIEMLSLTLDGCVHEIDSIKRDEVSQVITDILHDEFSISRNSFVKCINKISELVENSLGS